MSYESKGWRDNRAKWLLREAEEWTEEWIPVILAGAVGLAFALGVFIGLPWLFRTPCSTCESGHSWPAALWTVWVGLAALLLFGVHRWAHWVNGKKE